MTHDNQTQVFLPQRGDKVTRNGSLFLNSGKSLSGDETTSEHILLPNHTRKQDFKANGEFTVWKNHDND